MPENRGNDVTLAVGDRITAQSARAGDAAVKLSANRAMLNAKRVMSLPARNRLGVASGGRPLRPVNHSTRSVLKAL
jgi:hypothetical protein